MSQTRLEKSDTTLRLLSGLVRTVAAAEDEATVVSSVARTFREAFGFELVTIFLRASADELALVAAAGDLPASIHENFRVPADRGLVGRAFAEEKLLFAPDVTADPDYRSVPGLDVKAEIAAPIRLNDRCMGVLDVQTTRAGTFTAEDAEIVAAAADLLSVAIARAHLITRLERQRSEAEGALLKARSVEQTKDRFLSAVSHEFRTPLTSIRSFAEILLTHDTDDPETTREFLTIIHEESIRLTRLVNNLLDLSKMQAGRMEWDFHPNELPDAIRRAVRSVSSLSAEKEVEIEVDGPETGPSFVFDRDKIIQVVVNLLSNALKFSPAGSKVTILIRTLEDGTRITVRDRGPGISSEDRARVFERFRQVGTASAKKAGTGLGLSITREIVSAHGGSIRVDAGPEGGSDFIVELPSAPPSPDDGNEVQRYPAEEEPAVLIRLPAASEATILIVDDEEHIRRFLTFELTRAGYRVREAADGVSAIHEARESAPDLILLDMYMPVLSGRDVLLLLAGDPKTADVPVLVLSVATRDELHDIDGVHRTLRKPVDTAALLSEVAQLIRS